MAHEVNDSFEQLRAINPGLLEGFQALRNAVKNAGPLDDVTRELILISAFACAGIEPAFKRHCQRLLEMGVERAKIQHAIFVPAGSTVPFMTVVVALRWLEEL
jgi:alkylhydroperoxidase/carboxymuconolactone decarboxylase family protein YurZ